MALLPAIQTHMIGLFKRFPRSLLSQHLSPSHFYIVHWIVIWRDGGRRSSPRLAAHPAKREPAPNPSPTFAIAIISMRLTGAARSGAPGLTSYQHSKIQEETRQVLGARTRPSRHGRCPLRNRLDAHDTPHIPQQPSTTPPLNPGLAAVTPIKRQRHPGPGPPRRSIRRRGALPPSPSGPRWPREAPHPPQRPERGDEHHLGGEETPG